MERKGSLTFWVQECAQGWKTGIFWVQPAPSCLHVDVSLLLVQIIALLLTVGLWVTGSMIGVGSVAAALVGLALLLVCGVIQWQVTLLAILAPRQVPDLHLFLLLSTLSSPCFAQGSCVLCVWEAHFQEP